MRRHSLSAAMMVAGLAMCAVPRAADEMTEAERKTPQPDPDPTPAATNLPGETNRQFAARLKGTRT